MEAGQWKVKVSKGKKPKPPAWSCPVCSNSNPPISKQCSSCNTFRPQRQIPGVGLAEVPTASPKNKAKPKKQKKPELKREGSELSETKPSESRSLQEEFSKEVKDEADLQSKAVDQPKELAKGNSEVSEISEGGASSSNHLHSTLANLVYVILLGEDETVLERCVKVFGYCLFHCTLPKDARQENVVPVVSQDLQVGRRVVVNRDFSEVESWITLAGLHKIPPEQCGLLVVGNVSDIPDIPAGMNSWTLEIDHLQAFFDILIHDVFS